MQITLNALTDFANLSTPCLAVGLFKDGTLTAAARELDSATDGLISTLYQRKEIKGDCGDTLMLQATSGCSAERILLIGFGEPGELSAQKAEKVITTALQAISRSPAESATLDLSELATAEPASRWAREVAKQAITTQYRYATTLSEPKPAPALNTITLQGETSEELEQAIAEGVAIGEGINTARLLGDLPGNICTPSYLAEQALKLAVDCDALEVKVLDEAHMQELNMGALLSVSAGSEQPAKLIVMHYRGGDSDCAPHVLVGKGITFDSGGISIKPGAKMDEMKYDMCGAASVLGTMTTLTRLSLPINVIAIVAAAENLPSGRATKPGDVVTSMSGQTIEILNTDAEGRLVLCDALTYAEQFKPASVIDIATLTGACVVALGKHASGLYSNQQAFAEQLLDAGLRSGDRAWQMPLWDEYQPQLDSNFADMGNVGGPEGGSITAACFLSRFTKEMRWAHLDIAGTAWTSGAQKGATGRPVALLSQYLIDQTGNR